MLFDQRRLVVCLYLVLRYCLGQESQFVSCVKACSELKPAKAKKKPKAKKRQQCLSTRSATSLEIDFNLAYSVALLNALSKIHLDIHNTAER